MLIKDILNHNLITCDINSSINELSRLMSKNNIGFVAITEDAKVVGVITDRDIIVRGLAHNIDNIRLIMSTNIVDITSDKSIEDALNLYYSYKIKRLIVSENGGYVGVLSLSDILKSNYDKISLYNTIKNIFSEDISDNNVEVDSFYL